MPLAWLALALDLVEAILAGKQPRAVSLGVPTKQPLPMDWESQRRQFANPGGRGLQTTSNLSGMASPVDGDLQSSPDQSTKSVLQIAGAGPIDRDVSRTEII
jgi:hypothetical protein